MPRSRKKNANKIGTPFVPLTWVLLNSKAYRELPQSAAKALPYFIGKDGRGAFKYGEEYGGIFEFTYDEAIRLGFAKRTFAKVLKDLVSFGFIEMAGYGGLRGNCKSFNKFRLSIRWKQYGTPQFENVPRYPSEL
jgi:hypothetical protein